MELNNIDRQKNFLRKEAERLGISINSTYSSYFAKELLKELAVLNYGEYVIKGSFSQYVHTGKLLRPFLDIDLSSNQDFFAFLRVLNNLIEEDNTEVKYSIYSDIRQTKNGVYKIPLMASLKDDNKEIRVPLPIDFKEYNNIVFETQFKKVEPLFEGDLVFYTDVPSFEEHLAEKLYIILHCKRSDILNTRVKDFYDIYNLHGRDYDMDKFSLYFQMMLIMYGEDLNSLSSNHLNSEFVRNHRKLWESIKEKYQFVNRDLTLEEAVFYAKAVLNEQIQKVYEGNSIKTAESLVRKIKCK